MKRVNIEYSLPITVAPDADAAEADAAESATMQRIDDLEKKIGNKLIFS